MSTFMHSAVSFGTPETCPRQAWEAAIGPISLHNAIGETLDTLEVLGLLPERLNVHLDRGYDSESTREKTAGPRLYPQNLRERKAIATTSHETLGGGTHQLLAQRPTRSLCGAPNTGGVSSTSGLPSPRWS